MKNSIRCKEYINKDCENYYKGDYVVLSELVCGTRICSFYKPKKKEGKDGRNKR